MKAVLVLILLLLLMPLQNGFAKETFTIGVASWSGYPECVQGFKDGLAEAGLVEGEQLRFLSGELGADKALQAKVAEEFKASAVDLVFSMTTVGTAIVKQTLPETTPIVFSIVTYPADSGLIESFEYSGNNLVGTSNYVPLKHHVNLLHDLLPKAKTVAIFHRKGEPNSKIQTANLVRLFKRKGIVSVDVEVTDLNDLKQQALGLTNDVDVFFSTTDTLMQRGGEKELIKISLSHNIPILSSNKEGIEQGSTFGVVADFYTIGKMSGAMAAEILNDKALPESLESKLQEPPSYMLNRASIETLNIKVPDKIKSKVVWVN